MERSAKFGNAGPRPQVALTVDDVPDPGAPAPRGDRYPVKGIKLYAAA